MTASFSYVPGDSTEIADGIVRADRIDEAIKAIKQADPSDITDLVCVYLVDYFGNYVCITTVNSAYLIPFSAKPDFTGLENGKLYKLSEAVRILNKNSGFEDEFTEQNAPATGDPSEMLSVIGSMAAITMIFTAKKRKKSK